MITAIVAGMVLTVLILYVICWCLVDGNVKRISISNKHLLITGGSQGIGYALAREAIKMGASCVTLFARNTQKLENAKNVLERDLKADQQIQVFSVDVTETFDILQSMVSKAVDKAGQPVDILVNNAGASTQASFECLDPDSFEKQMKLNYVSAALMTKIVIPHMKSQQSGRVVFVSSMAAQIGLFGYSAYSASKAALTAFCQALQMEIKSFGVRLTLAFPPNTDTEGYKLEQSEMPIETKLISGEADVLRPEDVARQILIACENGKFQCEFGIEGWMLGKLTAGCSPVVSPFDAFQQILLGGVLRLVTLIYLKRFDWIINKANSHSKNM